MNKNLLSDLLIDIMKDNDEIGILRYAQLFLNDGANINPESGNKHATALLSAVNRNHISVAKFLIEHGAFLDNICNPYTYDTLLMIAVRNKSIDLVKLLVEKGININAESLRETATSIAISENFTEIAEFLISHGGKANNEDDSDTTTTFFVSY